VNDTGGVINPHEDDIDESDATDIDEEVNFDDA
jgi:hypothetical protein